MEYKYGRFKFKRSGLFGRGDNVKVYYRGEYVDDFSLYEVDSQEEFEDECREWFYDNGIEIERERG